MQRSLIISLYISDKGCSLKPVLLSIIEIGGYPDFSKIYAALGYEFIQVPSMRKGIQFIKKNKVNLIVAEFNYQSDFRDRTSQLETLMAAIQPKPDIQVIVFFDKEQLHQLERLTVRFESILCLPYPISKSQIEHAVTSLNL